MAVCLQQAWTSRARVRDARATAADGTASARAMRSGRAGSAVRVVGARPALQSAHRAARHHPIRRWPRNSRNFACCEERRGGTGAGDTPRRSSCVSSARERQWIGRPVPPRSRSERRSTRSARRSTPTPRCWRTSSRSDRHERAAWSHRTRAELVPLPAWPTIRSALPGLRADLDMSASVRVGPLAEIVQVVPRRAAAQPSPRHC